MEECYYMVLSLDCRLANKGGKIMWVTKDMVMYHLKKLNNNNTDLVVGGLNSTVLLDYSPAN